VIVSAAERTILDALVISPDLPAIQARAQVVLRAAEGLEDGSIAAELSMRRKDVLHWRKRFEAQGIRGLWDPPGPGPKKRVSPEKERALLWEVLYAVPVLNWSVKLLALQHRLNRSAVNRIFTKHGIVRDQRGFIDIEQLKVFADPLFGLTVSGIAGLYYGWSGVLALVSTSRPFSELHLMNADVSVSEAIDEFLAVLGKLAELRTANRSSIVTLKKAEAATFVDWLNMLEARRESLSEVHLLMDLPERAPQQENPSVQEWLREHPHFKVLHTPVVKDLRWLTLVRRCFRIIGGLPMQVNLIKDVKGMAQYLANMPDEGRMRIIIVCHPLRQ